MGAIGLLRVVSNRQLKQREDERVTRFAEAQQNQPFYIGLAGHIEKFWQSAKIAKRPIEERMLRSLRQRNGIYEPSELALIRQQGGSEIFMMLTSAKCRAAESWLREILTPDTDRPWGLEASPIPDLPPFVARAVVQSIAQQAIAAGWSVDDARIDERLLTVKQLAFQRMRDLAKKIAERHEAKIADQFAEGGWDRALSELIYDLVTYPAAIIKGPSRRMREQLKWMALPNGQWHPGVTRAVRPEFERRSPFDIYPAPAMRDIQYGNLIDRYRFTRAEMQQLIGVPGYSEEMIYAVLEQYGDKGYNSSTLGDLERAQLELREHEQYDHEGTIEALNFWGSCSGKMLLEWSFENAVPLSKSVDTHREYQIEAWKIGRYVIKATLNEDPLGHKPYSKVCFDEIPGAFWGNDLPYLISDAQAMCNGAARAVANNAAVASGPQVVMYVDRLADGERPSKPYPWKLYQMTSDMAGANREAVHFFQPNMNVTELLGIYNHFERIADNVSGFPNYSYGDSRVGGAGRTSSGLAQLMGNVGKGVKRVVQAVDRCVLAPMVGRMYNYNMMHDPDPTIKGDLRYTAKGAAAVLVKDLAQLRQKEILQATLNPIDAQIIGPKGRAEMLRDVIKSADFRVDKILPDEMQLELNIAGMPPPHELLGNAGPNAEGGNPGMSPGGGTPEGAQAVGPDAGPLNGTPIRKANSGYRDGGPVQLPTRFRFFRGVTEDGVATLEMEQLDRED